MKLKLNLHIKRATNFSQDDNTDADGRSATLVFNFNKHFLQIPRSFATITIVRSDASTAAPANRYSAPGTTADQTEISFISESQYDPTVGRVTFKLNNLDRFHTYDIKNFEIGGVKIDHLASSTNLKFTPTVQQIFLADLEVKGLKTGTTGVIQELQPRKYWNCRKFASSLCSSFRRPQPYKRRWIKSFWKCKSLFWQWQFIFRRCNIWC
ncbi:hypothetical protein [Mesomycoplasma ovipneumoniae]|uniref:hypothetical protein n=1 Tax=Mesomycoplasma ovipneumoniae TaxID=29562 RepID=UPI0031193169